MLRSRREVRVAYSKQEDNESECKAVAVSTNLEAFSQEAR